MNTSEHDCQELAATTDLKSYIFLSRLGSTPSFEMLHFLQPHVPKPWQWLLYSRLGFPSLETFRGKELQHYRPLPRIMSFMTWSSKTWTHLEIFFKTWLSKSWNFSGYLAFQVLKLFGVKNFNIIDPCQELRLSWLGLPRHELIWKYFWRLGSHSSEILHVFKTWNPKFWNVFLQFHVPKSWQWLHYSRLGFPTLETFWAKEFQQYK